MIIDHGFSRELARRENEAPVDPPERCPACQSIDISASSRCLHCGTKVDEEGTYEERENVG